MYKFISAFDIYILPLTQKHIMKNVSHSFILHTLVNIYVNYIISGRKPMKNILWLHVLGAAARMNLKVFGFPSSWIIYLLDIEIQPQMFHFTII